MGNGLEDDYLKNPEKPMAKLCLPCIGIHCLAARAHATCTVLENSSLSMPKVALFYSIVQEVSRLPAPLLLPMVNQSYSGRVYYVRRWYEVERYPATKTWQAKIATTNFSGPIKARNVIGYYSWCKK